MKRGLVVLLAAVVLVLEMATAEPCIPNSPFRTYDGTCNNPVLTSMGAAGQFYRRGPEGAEYQPDGSPVTNRPNERVLSNKVSRGDIADVDPIPHSLMATQFGQFINHDLNNNGFDDPTTLSYPDHLEVPELDDSFCWVFAGPTNFTLVNKCLPPYNQIPLFTTKFSEKVVVNGRAEVVSHATAWLDLSTIYGTSAAVGSLLRTHQDGRLLTQNYIGMTTSPAQVFGFFQFGFGSVGPFDCIDCPPSFAQTGGQVPVPPLMNPNLPNPFGYSGSRIFVSGDERVGENGALSMFHTLFIRNHNRHAALLAQQNPTWDDEQLFQRARRRNIAEYQNVVLYQYMPTEFGNHFDKKIGSYKHYDPYMDAEVNIAFASAAFRYGHSSFRNYAPIDQCGLDTLFNLPANGARLAFGGQTGGPILPIDVYGQIGSWENVIRGLIATRTAPNDIMIDSMLRDLPFNFPFAGGTDVFVLDLHRARENGVPNYVTLQAEYGKGKDKIYGSAQCPEPLIRSPDDDPAACFNNLVPYNQTLADNLRQLYGKVLRVDPLVGLLVEPHASGTSFGETLGSIIMDTYKRARDGDRFWFENDDQPMPFSEDEIEEILEVGMADLLVANFNLPVGQVPGNPFLTPPSYVNNLAASC